MACYLKIFRDVNEMLPDHVKKKFLCPSKYTKDFRYDIPTIFAELGNYPQIKEVAKVLTVSSQQDYKILKPHMSDRFIFHVDGSADRMRVSEFVCEYMFSNILIGDSAYDVNMRNRYGIMNLQLEGDVKPTGHCYKNDMYMNLIHNLKRIEEFKNTKVNNVLGYFNNLFRKFVARPQITITSYVNTLIRLYSEHDLTSLNKKKNFSSESRKISTYMRELHLYSFNKTINEVAGCLIYGIDLFDYRTLTKVVHLNNNEDYTNVGRLLNNLSNSLLSEFDRYYVGGTDGLDINDIRKVAPTLGLDIKAMEAKSKSNIINDQVIESISALVHSSLIDSLQNYKVKEKKIKLKYYMPDASEFDRLQSNFRQYRLEIDPVNTMNHDHAYQANSRILENMVLDDMLEYDHTLVSRSDAYDFVYGEVGADPKQIIKDKKYNVHCCCPVLSLQDTARKTKSDMFILEELRKKKFPKIYQITILRGIMNIYAPINVKSVI